MFPLNVDTLAQFITPLKDFASLVFLTFMVVCLVTLVVRRRGLVRLLKLAVRGRARASREENVFALLTGWAMMLILIWLLYMFRGSIQGLPGVQPPPLTLSEPIGGEPSAPSPPQLSLEQTVLQRFVFQYLNPIIMLAVAFVGVAILLQALKEAREEAMDEPNDTADKETMRTSAFEAVQGALVMYEDDQDFRAAVIRCYRRLSEILADHGYPIPEHETVREFEAAVSRILNLPTESLAVLTNLFEEARYSPHVVDEAKRNEAIRCLTDIKDCLAQEGRSG